ncbi:DUF998 domain-containing protein [Streptococcus sp. DD12]|uniref:DUF998 domain-containing protein n=1 Tax=Streptococcus sp. DD12 TaxID=1777880 RepID=UPI00079BDB1F|nr:DUF998 domain-containing protein [Streptococcus sp. DD12]KXT76771.1 hypothetical protein STRDD12_00176 [Streptococcus sp. DD12]
MSRDYYIKLSQEVVDNLHLASDSTILGQLEDNRLILLGKDHKKRWQVSNNWLMFLSVVLALIFTAFVSLQGNPQVSLTGRDSISSLVIGLSGPAIIVLFAWTLIKNRQLFQAEHSRRLFWRNFPVVVLAVGVIFESILIGFFWMLEQFFSGASFDIFTSTLIFGILTYFLASAASLFASLFKARWLTYFFTLVIIIGVTVAMVTNKNAKWWQHNLSFLGTNQAHGPWAFNLTLILSALIFIALIDYLFATLRQLQGPNFKHTICRILLSLLGLDLGLVGYFPNDPAFHRLHNEFAGQLIIVVLLLIVTIRFLMPELGKEFYWTSYIVGAVLLGLEVAFQIIHYLSLTAFELTAFVLAFAWLMLLLNRIQAQIYPEKDQVLLVKTIKQGEFFSDTKC